MEQNYLDIERSRVATGELISEPRKAGFIIALNKPLVIAVIPDTRVEKTILSTLLISKQKYILLADWTNPSEGYSFDQ